MHQTKYPLARELYAKEGSAGAFRQIRMGLKTWFDFTRAVIAALVPMTLFL